MCQKQNQAIIRATDVWVSELGGYEMIIFIEYENFARHFCDMLTMQDARYYCFQFTDENFEEL